MLLQCEDFWVICQPPEDQRLVTSVAPISRASIATWVRTSGNIPALRRPTTCRLDRSNKQGFTSDSTTDFRGISVVSWRSMFGLMRTQLVADYGIKALLQVTSFCRNFGLLCQGQLTSKVASLTSFRVDLKYRHLKGYKWWPRKANCIFVGFGWLCNTIICYYSRKGHVCSMRL